MKPEDKLPAVENELNKLEEEYAQGLKDGTMFDILREVRRKIKSLKSQRVQLKEQSVKKDSSKEDKVVIFQSVVPLLQQKDGKE